MHTQQNESACAPAKHGEMLSEDTGAIGQTHCDQFVLCRSLETPGEESFSLVTLQFV